MDHEFTARILATLGFVVGFIMIGVMYFFCYDKELPEVEEERAELAARLELPPSYVDACLGATRTDQRPQPPTYEQAMEIGAEAPPSYTEALEMETLGTGAPTSVVVTNPENNRGV